MWQESADCNRLTGVGTKIYQIVTLNGIGSYSFASQVFLRSLEGSNAGLVNAAIGAAEANHPGFPGCGPFCAL